MDSHSTASLCNETPKSILCCLLHGNKLVEQTGTANPSCTPRRPWFTEVGSKLTAGSSTNRYQKEAEIRVCFQLLFFLLSYLLLRTLRLTKLPLLGSSQVLLDNLPQILLAPQDALNSLVGWDPALLVTMVTATHSSPGSIHHFS